MKKHRSQCPERDEAIRLGLRFYYVATPCPKGHTSGKRYTSGGNCVDCLTDRYRGHRTTTASKSIQTSIYVIEAGDFIKVGIASDIMARLAALKTNCPLPVSVAFLSEPMPRAEAMQIEKRCHWYLLPLLVHGEWFRAPAQKAIAIINKPAIAQCKNEPESTQLRLIHG